jgi:hypothetical protein
VLLSSTTSTFISTEATEIVTGCRLSVLLEHTHVQRKRNTEEPVKRGARVESRDIEVRDSKRYLSLMLLTASGWKEHRCNEKEELVRKDQQCSHLSK